MSRSELEALFHPLSVAVLGASAERSSLGGMVMRNLLAGGFRGPVLPVNAQERSVQGVLCYRCIADLPVAPDLAVVCAPPRSLAEAIDSLGERGARVVTVPTADPDGAGLDTPLKREILAAAKARGLLVLGPGSAGVQVPGIGLNASSIPAAAAPGRLALVSQSGSLAAGVLEWAGLRGVGFSHVISAGDAADIWLAGLLDYLAGDAQARAILLCFRSVREARPFMSAARAAARIKPVIAIKAGRQGETLLPTSAQPFPVVRSEDVYDAAIRRAGMLRVYGIDELFDAVETLACGRPLIGDRLVIASNGSGPAEAAADTLVFGGGSLAAIPEETAAALRPLVPTGWPVTNPINLGPDADSARYRAALGLLLEAPGIDALLVMHAPTALAPGDEVAAAVAGAAAKTRRNVLACWLGASAKPSIHPVLAEGGVPVYETPDKAARAFLHLVRYRRNQEMLMEVPSSLPSEDHSGRTRVHGLVTAALAAGRRTLDEEESATVLAAYGVPCVATRIARDPQDAALRAMELGFPAAVRLSSPTVSRRLDLGATVIDLTSSAAVLAAAQGLMARQEGRRPEASFAGFVVQRWVWRPDAAILMAGIAIDPIFGPLILFGQGGAAVHAAGDHAVALPPLSIPLARELICRTRVSRTFQACSSQDRRAPDEDALRSALVGISCLAVDVPEIAALEINPILSDSTGILAVDARIAIEPTAAGEERLAIRPYPAELEERSTLRDGRRILLRPIRPEDEPAHRDFLSRLDPEDVRMRFFSPAQTLSRDQMASLVFIDYDREMAFVATSAGPGGEPETLGVVRTSTAPDNSEAEFALVVRSDVKRQGLGRLLLEKMIRYCRRRGTGAIFGLILKENSGMRALCGALGFSVLPSEDVSTAEVRLDLAGGRPPV